MSDVVICINLLDKVNVSCYNIRSETKELMNGKVFNLKRGS